MVLEMLYIVLILLRISSLDTWRPTEGSGPAALPDVLHTVSFGTGRVSLSWQAPSWALGSIAAHVIAARALSSLLCHSSSAVAPALSHLQLFTVIRKNRAHRKERAVC